MRNIFFPHALLVAASVFAPSIARAQFMTYTSLSSFTAALSITGTDSFNNLPQQIFTLSPLVRTAASFGYRASTSTSGFFPVGASGDAWLSTNEALATITFDKFLPTVRGIGGFFFGTDVEGAFVPGQSITLVATDANGAHTMSVASASTSMFFGFVSASTFTSLTVEAVQPDFDFTFPTVNNLVLGSGQPSSTVPEPHTFVLVAAGVAGVLITARRRGKFMSAAPSE